MKKLLLFALFASPLFGMRVPKPVSIIPAHRSCTVALRTFATQKDQHTLGCYSDNETIEAIKILKETSKALKAAQGNTSLVGPVILTTALAIPAVGLALSSVYVMPIDGFTGVSMDIIAFSFGCMATAGGIEIKDRRELRKTKQENEQSILPQLRKRFRAVDPKKWQDAKNLMTIVTEVQDWKEVGSALEEPVIDAELVENKQ